MMDSSVSGVTLEQMRASLHAIYRALEADVARAGPGCALSGRCCRFAEYGHTLFVSKLEARLLVADAPAAPQGLDRGQTCPWQDARGHCTAREARPLGCRVYYCDPTYEQTGHEISERYVGELKRLCEALGVPWDYRALHQHLEEAESAGLVRFPQQVAVRGLPSATQTP